MAWPTDLQIALKEWASVCSALESGRQVILLRKGGIQEWAGGFEIESRQFLLFPTYLHQNPQMLKPEDGRDLQAANTEPAQVILSSAGVITDIVRLQTRAQMDALDSEHIWTAPLIDMRFNYRPENPLYLLLVRTYRLNTPIVIDNIPAYAGCKSWVPLSEPIATGNPAVVLDEVKWSLRRQKILETWPSTDR